MSTQIAVRLPDDIVEFVDEQVRSGRARSRADVVAQALSREARRERAAADVAKIVAAGTVGSDLDGLAGFAGPTSLDID